MSFEKWLSAFKNRLFPRTRSGRDGRSRFTCQLFHLEDRCVPAAFVPSLPATGTVQAQGLAAVLYTPESDANISPANLPEAKLVTIMNNDSSVIFPIFQGTNNTPDLTAGTVTRAFIDSPGQDYHGEYDVTFSLGTGPGTKRAATAIAAGNGGLYSITLGDIGVGYLPTDVVTVASIVPRNGASNGTNAVLTAHVSNLTADQNGKLSLYDPRDPFKNSYRGYVGETVDGVYQLGLQPGHQVTVQVPPAFWDGGRIVMVSNGPVPLTSAKDPGFPLQADKIWTYNPSLAPNDILHLGSGRSFIVAPTAGQPKPFYGANFVDPATGYANPSGVVMWYHEERHPSLPPDDAAHGFGLAIPAVLTEATFHDPNQPSFAPNMRPDQILLIDNYDVSYVDSLAIPASMEATGVPSIPPTTGTDQFAWTGADQSTTDMQAEIAKFTTPNTAVNSAIPPNPNGLGTYFGGLGWDLFYTPGDDTAQAGGEVYDIDNRPGTPVTISADMDHITSSSLIEITGVKGQTAINGIWPISNLTDHTFALVGLYGNGVSSSGGTWSLAKATGIHLQKVPSGYDAITQSPNLGVASLFDQTKFSLQSGGVAAQISVNGASSQGSNLITGVSTDVARKLVEGMLLAADPQYFPYATTISRIQLGTAGKNDSILVMSNKAVGTDPARGWLFFGSQYGTPPGQTTQLGTIAPGGNKITGLDPAVGIRLRPYMLVSGAGLQSATNTYIKSISPDFTTITLTQNGSAGGGSGPYAFLGTASSPILQAMIDNFYAWADYYVAQLTSGPAAAPTGTFVATTKTHNLRTDDDSIVLKITDDNFDMNLLRVGDVVTSALNTTLTPNATGTPATPGYDPSLNYTIVSFDQVARTVELSLPVQALTAVSDTFTFTPPQYVVRSSDAPAAAPKAISSVATTSGQLYKINTPSTAGLVDGMEITVSGVIDSATNLPSPINGRWIIAGVASDSFQLQNAGNANGETLTGGIWSTTAGTIPYTLDFTPSTVAITGISNPSGGTITITTGSTAGLVKGQQVTISGVAGQASINGVWTIGNITATSFELVGITKNGGPKGDGTPSSGGVWSSASALQFAQTAYDVLQTNSLLVDPATQASRSASLLGYVIGGNTGTFANNEAYEPITHRHTSLPSSRTSRQLRDEQKSLMRGVYDFTTVTDQSQWYPNPSTPTPGATLNGSPISYGVYNLNPYVWFIHVVLHNSSYGFSFDDDVANAEAASSTLRIAVGGNAYTGANPPAPNALQNREAFSPFAQWGTQESMGFIDTTSPVAIANAQNGMITVSGLSPSAVARLTASQPGIDHPGAYITTNTTGVVPDGVTVVLVTAIPATTQAITSISNPSNGTITIHTAITGSLGIGNLVTISGVSGQSGMNGRWLVTNVIQNTSFELQPTEIKGDGVASSGGEWTFEPSFVTFLKPAGYTPPTDNALHPFTFSMFQGTVVPAAITASVSQAAPGTVVTITGTGLTGVYGVSFNGYPGEIVDVTDTAVKVKVPIFLSNDNGRTNPGPTGKISVRNQSGASYSSADFTILAAEVNVTGNEMFIPDNSVLISPLDGTGFGGKLVSFGEVVHTFTVQNTGTSPLSLTGATISGANPGDFTVSALPDHPLAPQETFDFQVTFNPSGRGIRSAIVTITSDDADEGSYKFAVEGDGNTWYGMSTPVPGDVASFSGDADERFVEDLYQNLLDRNADRAGLAGWVAVYRATGSSQAVFDGIFNSDERRSLQVKHLYDRVLGRSASPEEIAGWVAGIQNGLSETDLLRGFLNSAEFAAGKDDAAFVQSLYNVLLGRSGSTSEIQSWVDLKQAHGVSHQQMIDGILYSQEYAALAFENYYTYFLGRPSDVAGLTDWIEAYTSHTLSETDIARFFLGSAEFVGMSR